MIGGADSDPFAFDAPASPSSSFAGSFVSEHRQTYGRILFFSQILCIVSDLMYSQSTYIRMYE